MEEVIHVLTYSKCGENVKVSVDEMLADKTRFCFLRCLCAFIRFISEEGLSSLRLLFKVRAAYFLLAERRGPWVQGSPLCALCRGGQTEGFLRAQGQTRWVLRNLGALIWLKFYRCHEFWCMALNKSFILENLQQCSRAGKKNRCAALRSPRRRAGSSEERHNETL